METPEPTLVEKCELPSSDDVTPVVQELHQNSVTEVDLSGYNYDLVPTYKMIEDPDDQDTLFRIQFLQAFGISDDEYHPDIVSAVIDDLYERFRENSGIRAILEAHPLYHSHTNNANHANDETVAETHDAEAEAEADTDADSSSEDTLTMKCNCIHVNDNSEMVFCMMFSFQLFDLFHSCLRHAKHNEDIPHALRDEIKECFRTMF